MKMRIVVTTLSLIFLMCFSAYSAANNNPDHFKKIKTVPAAFIQGAKTIKGEASTSNVSLLGGCDTLSYHAPIPVSTWPVPDSLGDDFYNERFTMPYDGYISQIRIAFDAGASSGTPDAHIYVWPSDGLVPLDPNPPLGALHEFIVPYDSISWTGYTQIDIEIEELHLTSNEPFHVGFSHPHNPGDILAVLGDDGSAGPTRGVTYRDGIWSSMSEAWGVEVNFFIEVDVCADSATVGCCQFPSSCSAMTAQACSDAGGVWFAPPHQCIDYGGFSHCVYIHDRPQTTIVEPNDTSIWDKNYFSDTLTIQVVDFQEVSTVESTLFEYYNGGWNRIGLDDDGSTYWQDPPDPPPPGGDGWQTKWLPPLSLPEGYYMIRATMFDSLGNSASDTVVQYWDPLPPEVTILAPEVFNYPAEPALGPLDILFHTPGDNITEMYITVRPVTDYPGTKEAWLNADEFNCLQGYNKGVPHFNQHDLYPDGTDGNNRGCSATAMAACLKYWTADYPCLNDSGSMTDSQMVAEIAKDAGTSPNTGTKVKMKKPAIEKYIKDHCGECKFQPVKHLQGKDVTIKRMIKELFEEEEDVITGDVHHVTVVNSFCLYPKKFVDYMDPWTGTEIDGAMDVDSGFYGDPLIELVIVSPKVDTTVPPPDTIAQPSDIVPVGSGNFEYPWNPDLGEFPLGRAYLVNVEITDALGHKGWDMVKVELFLRGDATADGVVDVGDVVFLINYLFKDGLPPFPLDAGDVNCDGAVDVGDVVYLINYLFKGGPAPGCD